MKKYKVRITKMPGQVDSMAYGGQTNYGLDLGQRNVYDTMMRQPTDSISGSMTEKTELDPDEQYSVMAENNETIVGDIDQDGELEFQTIKGDYHSAPSGGTLLTNKQTPAKSFIFPQTKKMYIKDPEILKRFGVTPKKGGMSPADISKKFNVMNEKKVLDDPNADDMNKRTARMVKDNKEKKLQELAEVVESMKGFPQGQPNIHGSLATMGYGGYVPMALEGQIVDPYLKSKTPQGGQTPSGVSNRYNRPAEFLSNWEQYIPGFSKLPNKEAQSQAYQWMLQNRPDDVARMWKTYGLTNQGKKYKDLVGMTSKVNGKAFNFDPNKNFTDQELQSLEKAYVDGMFGVRQMDPGRRREMAKLELPPRKDLTVTPPAIVAGPPPNLTLQPPSQKQEAPQDRKDPYLPYNGIQMAQVMDAFTRPVKGYYDRPFVPEFVGMQAMYDQPNYAPLLSANNTRLNMMNQFGNAQAARATGTYNPDLVNGLITETQRARGNNLNIFNSTEQMNNQMYNQNNMMRQREMDQVRENNIRTNEQMDIAKQLKFQNAMNALGKMVGDRTEMQKYNVMYPQFAVTGRLWDQMPFVKGKEFGLKNSGSSNVTFDTWLASQPEALRNIMKSGSQSDQLKVVNMFDSFQRQRQNMMYRNPRNVQANMNNPYTYNMFDEME